MIDWIQHGVPLDLVRPMSAFDAGESLTGLDEAEDAFVGQEMARLLDLGVIEEVSEQEEARRGREDELFVSAVFLVPKKGSARYRLVIDFRPVNRHCADGTCEVEPLHVLPRTIEAGDSMCALDLSDGYFHLALRTGSRKYFAFRVGGRLYQYRVLPFGWSHAPGAFTTLLAPVVAELRSPGWARARKGGRTRGRARPGRLLWYLDDFLLLGRTPDEAEALRERAAALFDELGLCLRREKCQWEAVQRLEHLGLVVDTVEGVFAVGPDKALRLRSEAQRLLRHARERQRRVSKRDLARFTGLAQFASLAIRRARFRCRALYDAMGELKGWGGHVRLPHGALVDLKWWARLRDSEMARPIWELEPSITLHTDSSTYAWGGVVEAGTPEAVEARGTWTAAERESHITALELRAVTQVVACLAPRLQGRVVRHFEDNQAVVGVLRALTSPSAAMMREMRDLNSLLERYNIELVTEYIRSEHNVEADRLSREDDEPAWALTRAALDQLGVAACTVDRFASTANAVLPRFNARWMQPGAEAVDAFAQSREDWCRETNFCNPPWALLERLAAWLKRTGAGGLVVAPDWPRARWAPLLADWADDVRRIPNTGALYERGIGGGTAPAPRWGVVGYWRRPRDSAATHCTPTRARVARRGRRASRDGGLRYPMARPSMS